ncbi:hypothetical protein [Pseudalkalibacillus sp. SCS-8]|uniref:hypothetical protein n=1 Tax=Pseudalkalibacillus nanhaiensis TaxID=3115291 RepID=UPI0032D9B249
MWVWHPTESITTEEARGDLLSFSKRKKINVIYLYTGEELLKEQTKHYQTFIKAASESEIQVYALVGSPEWAKIENHSEATDQLSNVFTYNENSAEDEKFSGIQFDIEPYLLDEWEKEPKRVMNEYVRGLHVWKEEMRSYSDVKDFEWMVAIPFWFDHKEYELTYKDVGKPLAEHIMDIVGSVVMMAYRDFAEGSDSIIRHVQHEVDYATEHDYKVIIGVETKELKSEEKVTFFQEGETYMIEQLQVVENHFKGQKGYHGQAIHDYESYRKLKD